MRLQRRINGVRNHPPTRSFPLLGSAYVQLDPPNGRGLTKDGASRNTPNLGHPQPLPYPSPRPGYSHPPLLVLFFRQDPLSKERNGKELLRMSIVRGDDGERLMDTLVRPSNPVVDWRTDIHGVADHHLEGVMFTHR